MEFRSSLEEITSVQLTVELISGSEEAAVQLHQLDSLRRSRI